MSGESFRWRTIVELGVISVAIYLFFGTSGFSAPDIALKTSEKNVDVPVARAKAESLVYPDKGLRCERHEFDVHVFSASPLVIYVDGFVSESEAQHLVDISASKWQVSTVFNAGVESTDDSVRKSEKALIDRDEIVQCIEQRALSFQGWPQETFIERLWTQRYNTSGHYSHHYDWATGSKRSRRISTFMVYLGAECVGGGTNFPRFEKPKDERWCQFIDCDGTDEGVTFKARKGSAVFWQNFDADAKGYRETIHAGMPVLSGTKVGLNIWSWYEAGHKAPI